MRGHRLRETLLLVRNGPQLGPMRGVHQPMGGKVDGASRSRFGGVDLSLMTGAVNGSPVAERVNEILSELPVFMLKVIGIGFRLARMGGEMLTRGEHLVSGEEHGPNLNVQHGIHVRVEGSKDYDQASEPNKGRNSCELHFYHFLKLIIPLIEF